MIRFWIQVLLTMGLSYGAAHFLPGWSIALCAALISFLFKNSSGSAFWVGFLSLFLLWLAAAAYIDYTTQAVLSTKIAALFGFKSSLPITLFTGSLGGFIGGMGALSGCHLRRYLR